MSGERPAEDESPEVGAAKTELTLGQTLYTESGECSRC